MGPEEYDSREERREARREARREWRGTRTSRGGVIAGVSINRRHHKNGSIFFGLILTVLGVALLLDNLGIFEFRDIWRYWPTIFIAMGIGRIFAARRPSGWVWGGLFVAGGTLLLLRNLHVLNFSINGSLIVPLILIGFGTMMLVRALERSHYKEGDSCEHVVPDGTLSEWAVFTGTKRRVQSKTFQGGDLFAMFGGIDIDLRDAEMATPQANLDIQAMFGGVELRVPDTWMVDLRGMALFGGYDDKTVPPRIEEGKSPPRLVITGNAMFGGVSVRN